MSSIEEIRKNYTGNNHADTIVKAVEFLQAASHFDDTAQEVATIAMMSLVKVGDARSLTGLINNLPIEATHKIKCYNNCCATLLAEGNGETVLKFLEQLPRENVAYILTLYYSGCWLFRNDQVEAANAKFTEFRKTVHYYFEAIPFTQDDALNVSFRQGTLVDDFVEVERRYVKNAEAKPFKNFQLMHQNISTNKYDQGPIFFVSANPPYVKLLLNEFCDALFTTVPDAMLHCNLINADEKDVEFVQDIAKKFPTQIDISTVQSQHDTTTAYTCGRFFAMNYMLDFYQRKIIAVDIDAPVQTTIHEVIEEKTNYHFACIDTGRMEPASQYQASIMIFTPAPETYAFLTYLQRFCAEKIHQPPRINWMLDQAALYSVIHYLKAKKSNFTYFDLFQINQRNIKQYTTVTKLKAEKEKLKIQTQRTGGDQIDFDWLADLH